MSMAQHINLYDSSLLKPRDWLSLANVAAGGLLLLGAVMAAGMLARLDVPALTTRAASGETQLKAMREQAAALGQQVTGRKPDPRLEQEIGAAQLLLSARGEVLGVLQQRLGPQAGSFAEYLRGLGRQSMPGLWLTSFKFDAGGGMEIGGRTLDPASVPEYIRRLGRERAFQGRSFAALKLAAGKAEAMPGANTGNQAATTVAAQARAPYHEFVLIPVRAEGAGGSGSSSTPAGERN